MNLRAWIMPMIALLGFAWIVNEMAQRLYFEPRDERLGRIASLQADISTYEEALDREPQVQVRFASYTERTLGDDAETVTHELRSRLNTIGHGFGLTNLSVNTQSPRDMKSPAESEFRRIRALRDQPDFTTITADIRGQGKLEPVINAINAVASEPYIKRINRVSIRPRQNGAIVEFDVSLTTLFVSGAGDVPALSAPATTRTGAHATLWQKNVFAPPAPPPPPEPKPQPQPQVEQKPPPKPKPKPVPWHEWKVTAIVGIGQNPELWLRHDRGEALHLKAGEQVLDAVFVGTDDDDRAIIQIGEDEFVLEIGQKLSDRKPLPH